MKSAEELTMTNVSLEKPQIHPQINSPINPHLRIAWLLPVAWFYWQPALSEFTKLFPQTKVFTGLFPGYAQGCETRLQVETIGQFKVIGPDEQKHGYGRNVTYVSLGIVQRLFQFRPHLIFSNSFGLWTLVALLLKPIGGWKVVIAYEGSSPGVDYRHSWLRLSLRRWMLRGAAACITNSRAGKAYLTNVLGAAAEQVFAQPYEIPSIESLTNQTIQQNDVEELTLQHPIFLFVGRIVPRKGLKILLEACRILQEKGQTQYTLLIVGDGLQREELETYCQNHHLNQMVLWIGQVNYDRLSQYLEQADVFVLPSYEDTWGVALLEGLLFGKTIVCSSGVGSSELMVPGENGYVFDPQQPQQLADYMLQLIEYPDRCQQMGKRSRQIMSQHTPDRAARSLADVVTSVIELEANKSCR